MIEKKDRIRSGITFKWRQTLAIWSNVPGQGMREVQITPAKKPRGPYIIVVPSQDLLIVFNGKNAEREAFKAAERYAKTKKVTTLPGSNGNRNVSR